MSIDQFSFLIYFAGLYGLVAVLQLIRRMEEKKGDTRIAECLQRILLLAFSAFFIAQSSLSFVGIVFFETLWTYVCGMLLSAGKSCTVRSRVMLTVSIVVPLAMLGYYKYFDFFAGETARLLGLEASALSIAAPVGISFYTLTIIGYLVDVWRGDFPAERNFINCALFVSFFPKMVSGPIVRAKDFLPQMKQYRGLSLDGLSAGAQIFVFGLFKKMVLADHLGVFVNDVFYAPAAYTTATVWLAAFSYSLQIYFDFSGYTDMAVGLSKMLGIDLPRNFNLPFLAKNVSDLWNRWHISLSGWLRDYVYIPLGGSRKGWIRTYVNLLLVMLISGLWHGAGYTYLIWGAGHGILSCIHHFIRERQKGRAPAAPGGAATGLRNILSILATFTAFTLLCVAFRAEDMMNMLAMFAALFSLHSGIRQPFFWTFLAILILTIASAAAVIAGKRSGMSAAPDGFYPVRRLDTIPALTLFFIIIGLTVLFGYYGDTSFIYGKF